MPYRIFKSIVPAVVMFILAMNSVAQVNGTFTDARDGKVYKTVKIGTQTWMAENLAFKANSGCWAYKDDPANAAKYGYLYDWEAAQAACPDGWHLPTDSEWTTLITFLGGEKNAGGKLKSTKGWDFSYAKVTNTSGFTALPGGSRNISNGWFEYLGNNGYWWSSTEANTESAWLRFINYTNILAQRLSLDKMDGYSVRCVRDLKKSATGIQKNEIPKPVKPDVPEPGKAAEKTFTDSRDDKTYKTVKIGTQTWMAENLALE